MTIRQAVPTDTPEIRRIAEQGWNATYGEILSQETIDTALSEWYAPEMIRDIIERETVAYAVAEEKETLLGYVSGGPGEEETTASLGAIYVDPEHWGEGIGTALHETFEAFCTRNDFEAIQVQGLAENEIGQSFYRKNGYEIIDERNGELFGESVRECELRRQID